MIDYLSNWMLFAQEAAAEKPPEGISVWVRLLIVLAIFVLPFVISGFVGRALKLKDLSFKMGVVLFSAFIGLVPFVWQVANGHDWKEAVKPGIDLAGGMNLVFQVEETPDKKITNEVMSQMVAAVIRRVNPGGQLQVVVRKVGADRIEIIIPKADPESIKRIKAQIVNLGSLEFALLANERDHGDLIRRAQKIDHGGSLIRPDGSIEASWRPVGRNSKGEFKEVSSHGEVALREWEQDGQPQREFLVKFELPARRVTGDYLTRAYQTTDQNAQLAVGFNFNQKGGFLFQNLTSRNRPAKDGFSRRLAILLNNEIHSAPNIRETISGSGQITGDYSLAEIDELVSVLNAGALEVPIQKDPISQFSISATLGKDVQEKGLQAILIAGAAVVVFMVCYYWFAGLVADLCLLLNVILVMGIMSLIDATFTLPGLAGIVLTIGMAVDANVLIFERIREESQRGSSLRMSIHNGFGRAFTTIVDANVTTLITAVVLYMIGTDQVRGFAVTLFIGIVMSMFTALYFGRLLFDICERKRWIREPVKLWKFVKPPNWNFVSKKMIAGGFSLVVIIAGMWSLVLRGDDNLDIDFSGGTMVTVHFVEPQKLDEIRRILQQSDLGTGITLEELTVSGEGEATERGKLFRLRSKQTDVNKVREIIDTALSDSGHELRKVNFTFGEIADIATLDDGTEEADTSGDASEESDSGEEKSDDSELIDPEYAGGHSVKLVFSGEIPTGTAASNLSEELKNLATKNGQKRYEDPENLIEFEGTAGSGVGKETGEARRFNKMLLKTRSSLDKDDLKVALVAMQKTMAANPIFEEVNSFASAVADEMKQSAVMAMLASLVAIVAYIWLRFQRITFGFAAVAALVHDVLVVVGMVALASYASQSAFGRALDLYDFKINLPMIAAFLTIVGYSLNDTIVVFDRIREVRGKNPALTEDMVNRSLNQTLARTILTSLTTFVVVAILYAIGGEGIHGFAFCLVVGVIVGTYSSIYIASPVLLWLMNRPGSAAGIASGKS